MRQKYFVDPFATAGDITPPVPDAADPSGFVSYDIGFTFDYQRDLTTDPAAKSPTRINLNAIFNDITTSIQSYQQECVPEFITTAQNGGSPFSYNIYALVLYSSGGSPPFKLYMSLVSSNTDTPPSAKWLDLGAMIINARIRLTANTTFFVSTTGSDSNSGLASGSAWLTLQHALNVIQNAYDLNGFVATIQLAAGIYAGAGVSGVFTGNSGQGSIVIKGDITTPSNVVINAITSNCISVEQGAQLTIEGMSLQASGTGLNGNGLVVVAAGQINIGTKVVFGACSTAHMYSAGGGQIQSLQGYAIIAASAVHYLIDGGTITVTNGTVTITGTPAFTTFASVIDIGLLIVNSATTTFSGSATGVRYAVSVNSVINTAAGGATFLPGGTSGTTATGGIYV